MDRHMSVEIKFCFQPRCYAMPSFLTYYAFLPQAQTCRYTTAQRGPQGQKAASRPLLESHNEHSKTTAPETEVFDPEDLSFFPLRQCFGKSIVVGPPHFL